MIMRIAHRRIAIQLSEHAVSQHVQKHGNFHNIPWQKGWLKYLKRHSLNMQGKQCMSPPCYHTPCPAFPTLVRTTWSFHRASGLMYSFEVIIMIPNKKIIQIRWVQIYPNDPNGIPNNSTRTTPRFEKCLNG